MLDYVIKYHFPEILKQYSQENEKEKRYLTFFEEVVKRTARLVADWQLIGFTHGVLNTDNSNSYFLFSFHYPHCLINN